MTQPGSLGWITRSQPETAFGDEIRKLRERISQLEAQRPVLISRESTSTPLAATPTALTTALTDTVTVPSGFTAAAVFMTAVYVATGSGTSVTVRAGVDGSYSALIVSPTATARQWLNTIVTGVSGGASFDLTVDVASVGAWGGGTAYLTATVIFFR